MKEQFLNRFTLPVFGFFIKFCARFNVMWPIVKLTCFFIVSSKLKETPKQKRILVLTASRFRGDPSVLEETGDFFFLSLSESWQNRIIFSFFDVRPSFEAVFQPSGDEEARAHSKLKSFLDSFIPALVEALRIDAVISAAVHYTSDYLWGSHFSSHKTPFIIFHKECFHTTKERRDFWIEKWKPTGKNFIFDFCIFHNEIIRKNFADSGVFPLEKTASYGALRMDNFINKFYQKYPKPPQKKRITLFSFTHAVGLGGAAEFWSDYDNPDGFAGMFEDVHTAFGRFATNHPDVECILKPKWGGVWVDEFYKVFDRNGIDYKNLSNLRIIESSDVHELIEESTIICGYGSTTLLEASIVGRPVVVTLMNEALRDDYQSQIQMLDDLKYFDVATNEARLHQVLEQLLERPFVDLDKQIAREQLFNKWISSVKADARENYAIKVLEVIAASKH